MCPPDYNAFGKGAQKNLTRNMTANQMVAANTAKAMNLNYSAGRNANSHSRSTADLTHEQAVFS